MAGLKSRNKGKTGEREAVKFLKSIGYPDAQRTQQYSGRGDSDVVCPESLQGLHIEVKFGRDSSWMGLGKKEWREAVEQARRDAPGGNWIVLWKPKGERHWRLTCQWMGMLVTVTGGDLSEMLKRWETP